MRVYVQWSLRFVLVSLLILPIGVGRASADGASDFEEADLNGNGRVDRGEYHSRMMDRFYLLDEDRDGQIVPAELDFVDDRAFRKADANRDGNLTSAEYANSRFLDFVKADSNADGVLEPDEVEAWALD